MCHGKDRCEKIESQMQVPELVQYNRREAGFASLATLCGKRGSPFWMFRMKKSGLICRDSAR
jgi:hypothetical protein